MGLRRPSTSLGAAVRPTAQFGTVPASVGGVNSFDSLANMPIEDCIYTFNLMPSEIGLRLRKGYREWATGCGTEDVRTILPFEGRTAEGATDKLWAVTKEGIWDITLASTTTPTQDVVFTDLSDPAGFGVHCEFSADNGDHYLFYADGVNGLHQYLEGDSWSVPVSGTNPGEWSYDPGTGLTGFPVDDIAFVMVHKQRIWVVLENDNDAWYLPVAAIAGELKKFSFGTQMIHGGRLLGLWNWTIDGGDGVDDYLIALSRAGDVLVYRGEDPEITPDGTNVGPWQQTGSWFIGEMPASRRAVAEYGAEMYILSVYGITSLRDLLQGTAANELRNSPSAKVARFLRRDIEQGISREEWAIKVNPGDGFMQIITPKPATTDYVQYNQNLSTKAWGFWESVPMISADVWNGEYFIGAPGGVVHIYDGVRDGTTIAETDDGDPVRFRTLTSFQPQNPHALNMQVGLIRTVGVVQGTVTFSVQAVYDYAIETPLDSPPSVGAPDGNVWDSAIWDQDVWGFSTTAESLTLGTAGIGRTVAVGLTGSAANRINIIAWDLTYRMGGFL